MCRALHTGSHRHQTIASEPSQVATTFEIEGVCHLRFQLDDASRTGPS